MFKRKILYSDVDIPNPYNRDAKRMLVIILAIVFLVTLCLLVMGAL